MNIQNEDTIVAIGTRTGGSAIGIVKLSGPESIEIADKIFRAKNKKRLSELNTYSLIYGHIYDGEENIIDDVIVSMMRKPGSYTREDVVEINCHGGIIATNKVIEMCVENGARIAEPGEFTRRAFINGRIDLSQAEAVADIVNARTEEMLKIAAKNIGGGIKKEIEEIRKSVLDVLVQFEASIDFIEEDLEITPYEELAREVKEINKRIERLIEDEKKGEIVKNGIKAAIIGKPNVGKSSLLNILSKKQKAIVTSIPGTTRDAIEEILYIEGVPLILVDTAGIRKAKNIIEKIGVEKSLDHIEEAELVIMVLDGSKKIEKIDVEIYENIMGKRSIICVNKIDLEQKISWDRISEVFRGKEIIKISALKDKGIRKLEDEIKKIVIGDMEFDIGTRVIVNSRHKKILEDVSRDLKNAIKAMHGKMSEEFPSADLKIAYENLGEIVGKTTKDDVLDSIFSRFCIGK